jgi:hypothetical protein
LQDRGELIFSVRNQGAWRLGYATYEFLDMNQQHVASFEIPVFEPSTQSGGDVTRQYLATRTPPGSDCVAYDSVLEFAADAADGSPNHDVSAKAIVQTVNSQTQDVTLKFVDVPATITAHISSANSMLGFKPGDYVNANLALKTSYSQGESAQTSPIHMTQYGDVLPGTGNDSGPALVTTTGRVTDVSHDGYTWIVYSPSGCKASVRHIPNPNRVGVVWKVSPGDLITETTTPETISIEKDRATNPTASQSATDLKALLDRPFQI